MSLVEIRDLKVEYARSGGVPLPVLDIPELKIEPASQLCIRGGSGSGKTTLLNIIAGILSPGRGTVVLDGADLAQMSEAERDRFRGRKVGFVFQTFNLLSGFTAAENVLLGSVFAGDPGEKRADRTARARELLEKVGLSGRAEHRPSALSAGEQQRVAIARALMNRPRLVLADEPTGSLDEKNGNQVLDLMTNLAAAAGATLLLVTHDPVVMARFSTVLDLARLNKIV